MIQPELAVAHEAAERLRSLGDSLGLREGALGELLLGVVEQMGAGWAIKQMPGGRYAHVDGRLPTWLGLTAEQMIGRTDAELFGPDIGAVLRSADLTACGQQSLHLASHRIERERQRRDFDVMRQVLEPSRDGAPMQLGCVWIDTSLAKTRDAQLAKALAQLEQQQLAVEALRRETQDASLRDSVTGLYQRAHFDDQLRREVDLSSREHREFALVMIRIDPLSQAAPTQGTDARTRVLESIGRLLRNNTRAMDASCRVDADHFAVLLSGVGLATAHSRMEGLRRQCATQIVMVDGQEIGFTVAMGVASFPHTAQSQEELLNAVNVALTEATRRGGNNVTLASIRFQN